MHVLSMQLLETCQKCNELMEFAFDIRCIHVAPPGAALDLTGTASVTWIFRSLQEVYGSLKAEVPDLDARAGDKFDLARGWPPLHHEGKRREHDIAAPFRRPLVSVIALCRRPSWCGRGNLENSCTKKNFSMSGATVTGVDAEAWS